MSKKLLLGFIAGAAAGVLAGFLLAPEKGFVTRKKLLQKINDRIKAINDSLPQDDEENWSESLSWEHAERPYTAVR